MPCDYRFINAVHESENLKVEFGVKNNCNLFAQGDTVRYFININGMVPELKVAYIYFFNDAFGVSKYIEDEIVYENDGDSAYIEGEVPIKDTYKNGIYTFYLTIRKVGSLQFNIGVVPRADRASSDFYYGVQPYITKSGINAGAVTILVLSGETTKEILESSSDKPDIVLDSCKDILNAI